MNINVKYAWMWSQGEVASTFHFQKGNDHVAISAATPLHNCLAMRLLSDSQNLQKVGNDIVIFNGNVLGHAWHSWCKKGTNEKRMSCSLLVCYMRILKLIDFRTMGLWKWITYFLIRTLYSDYRFNVLPKEHGLIPCIQTHWPVKLVYSYMAFWKPHMIVPNLNSLTVSFNGLLHGSATLLPHCFHFIPLSFQGS